MAELKPCFWCGKISKGCIDVEEKVAFSEICFQVHCHMCGARGPFEENEQAAIDAWNKRSSYEVAASKEDLQQPHKME